MGELAEDIIDGSCCQFCMSYFEDKDGNIYVHDEPVVCWTCWKDMSNEDRQGLKRADVKTVTGD